MAQITASDHKSHLKRARTSDACNLWRNVDIIESMIEQRFISIFFNLYLITFNLRNLAKQQAGKAFPVTEIPWNMMPETKGTTSLSSLDICLWSKVFLSEV